MNKGRLNEQLFNEKLFNAYSMVKYLGNGNDTPKQDRQADILNGALWNDTNEQKNVLKTYNSQANVWDVLFKGYYHQANLTVKPVDPVEGQLWLDPNRVLRFYEDLQWKPVSAKSVSDAIATNAGLANFLIMPQLSQVSGYANNYLVPSVNLGKLFENNNYVSRDKYTASDVNFSYTTTNPLRWIHVNPTFMYGAKKRLIKITKTGADAYVINLPTNNTEFYGFKFGEPLGKLLTYVPKSYNINENVSNDSILNDTVSDYVPVTGGIKLINKGQTYDYIYAITYIFNDVNTSFGSMITDTVRIGTQNQVYVGQINDDPILFLDGLYLEQDYYDYNEADGVITFNGETITERMDMVVLSFNNIMKNNGNILELQVTNSNISNNNIVITHNNVSQVSNFTEPIAFICGVGTSIRMRDQIEINGNTITIKNFGSMESGDTVYLIIADCGSSYVSSGTVTGNAITNSNITVDGNYALFINGVCMSPREFEITNGQILIEGNLAPENGSASEYYLLDLSKGDDGVQILFDAPVSYFTTRIDDNNESSVYNDCNMVVSYAYNNDNTKNGVLIDENFIKVPLDTENAYVTGQILNIKTEDRLGDPIYEYYIYNAHGDYNWTKFETEFGTDALNKLQDMITQFNENGSISIMANKSLEGLNLTYYAYTYIDEVDEPLLDGNRNCVINVDGHITKAKQDFNSTKLQTFIANKGCVSAYVNGIQVHNITDYPSTQCKFTIDTPISNNFINWKNRDLYDIIKGVDESTTVDDLEALGLSEYAFDEGKLESLKTLKDAIVQMETKNDLYYMVERVEENETYACNRVITGPENRYDNFDNTYTSSSYIGPGAINVYLNGVLLEKKEYSIFDNCNIMLNEIQTAGGSDEYSRDDEETWKLIKYYKITDDDNGIIYCSDDDGKTWTTIDYRTDNSNGVKRIYCPEPDELLLELRPDTYIKKISYDMKELSYETQAFNIIDYDFPISLKNTKDKIKIYINGVLYTGKYTNINGVITLIDAPLQTDPMKIYFDSHPDEYKEYKKIHGEWISPKDRITFEWR